MDWALTAPVAERLAWGLLHFVWQGAVLAASLALLLHCGILRRSQHRYAAAVATLSAMAAVFAGTFLIGPGELTRTVAVPPAVAAASPPMVADGAGLEFLLPGLPADPSRLPTSRPSGKLAGAEDIAAPQNWDQAESSPGWIAVELWRRWQPMLLVAWASGVAALGLRLITGYCGTLWLRGGRQPVSPRLLIRASELGRRIGLGTRVGVYGSARVDQALAVGWWKPVVLVPLGWLSALPADVLEAVIAHELAHIRRWDRWLVLLQRLLETLLFYHPAVWWVSRCVSREREMCCDELAVSLTGRPVEYARALEAVGRQAACPSSLVFATSFQGERSMELLKRVRNVLGVRPQSETSAAWPAALLALTLCCGVAMVSLSPAWADDQGGKKPEAAAKERGETPREKEKPAFVPKEKSAAEKESFVPREKSAAEKEAFIQKQKEAAAGEKEAFIQKQKEGAAREKEPFVPKEKETAFREKEAAGREKPEAGVGGFKPETPREAALLEIIMQMRREMLEMRREMEQMRGKSAVPGREGGAAKFAPRDGQGVKPGLKDGQGVKPGAKDGAGQPKFGARDKQ